MCLFFVGGVNGTGKTSVARESAKKLPIRVLDGSLELMKWLGIIDGDYNKLRELPNSSEQLLQIVERR